MTKPKKMPVDVEMIPAELKEQQKWICWRWEKINNKWTKPPYDFRSHSHAKSNDPSTWGDFESAYKASLNGKYDGIGFMMSEDDPYSGIDFDDCYFNKEVDPEVRNEILNINSYTEVSPSGNGFKTMVRGKLPGPGHHSEDLGVFDKTRYFCITGKRLRSVSPNVEHRQDELNEFYNKHWPPPKPKEPTPIPKATLSDFEIIEKAMEANDDGKFFRLWNGEIMEYASASEADLALCSKLAFWVNGDKARVDYLFRQSKLMRDKWERDDYRNKTIDRACDTQTDGYKPGCDDDFSWYESDTNGQNGQIGHQRTPTDIQRTTNGQLTDKTPFLTDNNGQTTDNEEISGPTQMSLKGALKAWILMDKRRFRIQDVYNDLDIRNRQQKKNVSDYLAKFCDDGLIERVNGQRGVFLYKECVRSYIDFLSVEDNQESVLCLPLGLEALGIQVLPGNIIVVAGESNAGKTSLLMNIAHDNLSPLCSIGKYPTLQYFSSEMGAQEMRTRIMAFGKPIKKWACMKAIDRSNNFHQVIDPDGLNIIDFLEVHQEFYLVGEWIRLIHETLNDGICVIALQKKKGIDFGRSGEISLEKPRLYLAISEVVKGFSSCKIVKAKNYIAERNPNGLEKDFRITNRGAKLDELTDWRYVTVSERKRLNDQYVLEAKQEAAEYAERVIPEREAAYKFQVEGDIKILNFRDLKRWRESFSGLDVDEVLRRISEDSFERPFLSLKGWFHEVSGILKKKHKLYWENR